MTVRYRSRISDSARWDELPLRDGDIIISVPAKSGTTWTQRICSLLVFGTPELPAPMAALSPWLDQITEPVDAVVTRLEAQRHRRFIKTHTPLDGLPTHSGVTYVCMGRDPRDVVMSLHHHRGNMALDRFNEALADASPDSAPLRAHPDDDARAAFRRWVLDDTPRTEADSLALTVHHLDGFLDPPAGLDTVLLRFEDLLSDREAGMRHLAARLGVEVPEERWPVLVQAAGIEDMRSRAAEVVPNAGLWRDDAAFLRSGRAGTWRDVLTGEDLAVYRNRIERLASPALRAWLGRSAPR